MRIDHGALALLLGVTAAACAADDGSDLPAAEQAVEEASEGGRAPVLAPAETARVVPGDYIVVLQDGVAPLSVTAAAGVVPRHVYTVINGFAASMDAAQLDALRLDPRVAYIEPDQIATAAATQYMDAYGDPWGLDRINQRDLPLDGRYTYTYTGRYVSAYIIDTGLDTQHEEFEGRAANVYDAFGGNGEDCNGHGTHIGGIVGGKTYGVAKRSLPRGVRVLDCNGSGTYSGIIAGIDWIRVNRADPAVANMSLGGGYSQSLNDAVIRLSDSGVFVAVAAGGSNSDACNYSPASAGYATAVTTTAASDKTDTRSSSSNYGRCVDLYAPGSLIKSAWIGAGNTDARKLSGSSMSSPHVAGVAALVKHRYGNLSSDSVWSRIYNAATVGRIQNNPPGTPNLLLYKYITAW